MQIGRMSVALWETDRSERGHTHTSKRGDTETMISGVQISAGDRTVLVNVDDERDTWEITVVGKATIYHE